MDGELLSVMSAATTGPDQICIYEPVDVGRVLSCIMHVGSTQHRAVLSSIQTWWSSEDGSSQEPHVRHMLSFVASNYFSLFIR